MSPQKSAHSLLKYTELREEFVGYRHSFSRERVTDFWSWFMKGIKMQSGVFHIVVAKFIVHQTQIAIHLDVTVPCMYNHATMFEPFDGRVG